MSNKKQSLGIEADKEKDTHEWYTELITKGNLIEYTDVSGAYILKPKAQYMWDAIRDYIDALIKKRGVRNASFPLLIPENLLLKEKEHIEGFSPEVAWVTQVGDTKLAERLAIRPTSETIMYPAYAKWIRSHNDLPLKINQWCSVVRWEFKHPMPFLRSREFHWQEGHTAFATKKEAEDEAKDILLNVYKKTYEDLLAIPCLVGRKSDSEKFAGADYSLSCEIYLPIGKAIQGSTSHHLGQNFSKVFDIKFVDENQKKQFVYQNSWGFTTRSIGVLVMMHSDSKGLVIPPKIAENKVVIIPIWRKGENKELIAYGEKVKRELSKFDPFLDLRKQYSVGWKFNEAELNGVPVRVEIGQRELAANEVTVMRRDTLEKQTLKISALKEQVGLLLDQMQEDMLAKARKLMEENIVEENDLKKIIKLVGEGKMVKTVFDGKGDDLIKEKTGGKALVIPFDE
ncbi:MAG: proline--tRNA ligase, partial [Nanoarchaeota archaeon]|nr:proline--tRNA ligase [Nanoarchaeota archaeon]